MLRVVPTSHFQTQPNFWLELLASLNIIINGGCRESHLGRACVAQANTGKNTHGKQETVNGKRTSEPGLSNTVKT